MSYQLRGVSRYQESVRYRDNDGGGRPGLCEYRCRDLLEWHTRRRPSVRKALTFSAVSAGLLYVLWGYAGSSR